MILARMLEVLAKLLIVQNRDQQIRKLQRELKSLPQEEERARFQLGGDQNGVESAKKDVQENEVAIKNLELDIQTRKDTIAKLEQQRYTTKKNEEFAALGVEIERYQEEVRKLEDREILLMEKGETLGARLAKAQAKLDATAALVNEELAQIAEKKSNCESRIAELDAERAKLVDGVDDSTLGVYDRLMKSKGDAAVVPLEHGVCGGCHMKVITTTLHKVKAEKEIAQCEQCGRMLYLEE